MDAAPIREPAAARDAAPLRDAAGRDAFRPVERVEGALSRGALVICDHAGNALPPGYGTLGLPPEALDRHIAYDIGAARMARRLAARLGAPAVLSTFSRLLIDPNRGADDPTLVMRISDRAIVPGNARIGADEIENRRRLYWAPYRDAIETMVAAMLATGEPPAILSIHSFTPIWRGAPRRWKVAVLWDRDPRLARPLMQALAAEDDLDATEIGDNEPYAGGMPGDTVNAVATARGLANALVEVRQDLIADPQSAEAWGDRLARIFAPLIAPIEARRPQNWGSRAADAGRLRRGA
jgi:predicted N-formylglutamate amidohydrolase